MSRVYIIIYFRRWRYRSAVYYYHPMRARAHIVLVSGDNLRYAIITVRGDGGRRGGASGGVYVNTAL